MEWEGREESQNVEDRRGMGKTAGIAIGGGGILALVLALVFGVDPSKLLGPPEQGGEGRQRKFSPEEEKQARFTKVIFRDTEVVWNKLRDHLSSDYKQPKLVLFTDVVQSACGTADSAVGPFYCPGDSKVYIDLSFYVVMDKQLRAGGEFARAYVIAHEVGHHVQRFLTDERGRRVNYSSFVDAKRRTSEENEYSVRLELQADFLAGVWAHHANKEIANFNLNDRDIESAINAANQIGDDTLMKKGGGRVRPEKFTHGTSQQRMAWFKYGLDTGDVRRAKLLFDRNVPVSSLMPPRW